jgi:hypothetical protein
MIFDRGHNTTQRLNVTIFAKAWIISLAIFCPESSARPQRLQRHYKVKAGDV